MQDLDFLVGSDNNNYPIADKTRNINNALHDVTQIIWGSQDGWFFDDSGRTDYPRLLVNLTHGTQDYRVAAISTILGHIKRIEVKDVGSDFRKLKEKDLSEIGIAKDEYYSQDTLPIWYDLDGGYITLYPTPSSAFTTLASGMAVYFSRDAIEFATSATTATPGFATQFHKILSLSAAIDFERDATQRASFRRMKLRLEDGLKSFYGSRNIERKVRMTPMNQRRWKQYI